MENDLNRSVRLLEEALSTTGRGLFKNSLRKSRGDTSNRFDLSVAVAPHEYKRLLMREGLSIYDQTVADFLKADTTVTGNVLQANNPPWKLALDSLYMEFFVILQTHSGSNDRKTILLKIIVLNIFRGS